MVTRAETRVVYAAGAAQGIVLVTFPAASTIFTSPHEYDLSDTQYGFLFLPQVAAAITASLLGGWLGSRFATKRVYLAGLAAGLVSMLLLIVGQFFETDTSVAFSLLLVATAFLGVGFGLTVPALNTLTAAFHPLAADSSVLVADAQRHETVEPEQITMDMEFAQEGGEGPTPYEVLLHAAMIGDAKRFSRQDLVEQCWRVMQPVLDNRPPVHPYAKGSWGPTEGDQVLAGFGRWQHPWVASLAGV